MGGHGAHTGSVTGAGPRSAARLFAASPWQDVDERRRGKGIVAFIERPLPTPQEGPDDPGGEGCLKRCRSGRSMCPGRSTRSRFRRIERRLPAPGRGEVRLRVSVCGVCRTDLHLAEGDLVPHHHLVVPGHEVVGVVDQLGEGSVRFALGDRVGVPWLAHTCGICRFCVAGKENLCTDPWFTGWDRDGGYAPYVTVDERLRIRAASHVQRRRGGAPPVCGDHRLPGAAPVPVALRAGGSAFTGLVPPPISPPKSPWPRGRGSTC